MTKSRNSPDSMEAYKVWNIRLISYEIARSLDHDTQSIRGIPQRSIAFYLITVTIHKRY